MAVFNEPNQWEHPLGNNADTSTLPDDAAATAGIASLQKLFQIINATPLEAGGIAPDREDVNALFKYLGDQIFYTQNGGVPSYNAAYDYIAGRVVLYNGNLYKCIQANGASSTVVTPDSVSPLGSDYWVQVATLADFTNFADKDFSNVTAPVQAFKNMTIGWSMPDWSSVITITSHFTTANGSFTAPSNGYIQVLRVGDNYTYIYNKPNMAVTTTDNAFIHMDGSDGDGVFVYAFVPISKGQTIYQTSSGGFRPAAGRINFIPCKGAN